VRSARIATIDDAGESGRLRGRLAGGKRHEPARAVVRLDDVDSTEQELIVSREGEPVPVDVQRAGQPAWNALDDRGVAADTDHPDEPGEQLALRGSNPVLLAMSLCLELFPRASDRIAVELLIQRRSLPSAHDPHRHL
jgi:hypothetical protein